MENKKLEKLKDEIFNVTLREDVEDYEIFDKGYSTEKKKQHVIIKFKGKDRKTGVYKIRKFNVFINEDGVCIRGEIIPTNQ